MGVLAIIGSITLVLALVGAPLLLDVLASFFPRLSAGARRRHGLLLERGAAGLILAMCLLAYCVWLTRFLPYAQAVDPSPVALVVHVAVANALWFGTVVNWALACTLRPRALPRGRREEERACSECSGAQQAPATWHCRLCAACVPGFDHHCPFIANCVGAHNSACFLQFLLCSSGGCLYAAYVSFQAFFECIAFPVANIYFEWGSSRPRPDTACRLVQEYALLFLPTAGMCALVCALTTWQAYLRLRGESSAHFIRRWRVILGVKPAS
ncbi:DHHC palmitoyltransferase-domain-containing protein [Pavlovales sp. CCMP2436]|nr:DHHC palmitoyltransferase-domain-containing protein [Pavlovales sp. CCMP2436]